MPSRFPPKQRHPKTGKPAYSRGDSARSIGALFRSTRELQNLSQEQVAALSSGMPGAVSRTTVGDIERGKNLPSLEALISLSRVLHLDPGEVLERVDLEMTVPVDITGLSRKELFDRAEEHFWSGDFRNALATYDAILEHLALDPPPNEAERVRLNAKVEVNRAVALRRCGALRAAQVSAERAIDLAVELPKERAEAYMVLAALLSQKGRRALAADASSKAVELSREGDVLLQAQALTQQGSVLYRANEFENARQAFIEARSLFAKSKERHHLAHVEGNIGASLMSLGRNKLARSQFVKAIELARKHRVPAIEASWLAALGRLALGDNKLDEADQCAQAALRIAKARDHTLTIFRAEWLRHLVVRQRNPRSTDRQRLAYLTKLYVRLKGNEGLIEISEFEQKVIDATGQDK